MPLLSPAYPTADGWIPARWLDVFLSEETALEARADFRAGMGAAIGKALGSKDAGAKAAVRSLIRRAFPTLWKRPAAAKET